MQKDIQTLLNGYQRFRKQYFEKDTTTFSNLVHQGQNPKALMIACSDSRVDPALVMNCSPGDLFVIRNVANLVPPFQEDQSYHGTSAALEFGICVLEIPHVILFGHTQCGGIQTLLESLPQKCRQKSFLKKWMELAEKAHLTTLENHGAESFEEKVIQCGHYSLLHSLENLKTFPWIAERVQQGCLSLHAWNFDMSRGTLQRYDEDQKRFVDFEV